MTSTVKCRAKNPATCRYHGQKLNQKTKVNQPSFDRKPKHVHLAPIVEPATTMAEPNLNSFYHGETWDYDFLSYGNSWGYDEDNQYSVYTDLRLISVDVEETIRHAFLLEDDTPLPESLQKMITENRWDDLDEWDVGTERDYYGETAILIPPSNLVEKLQEWYWQFPNSEDREGILKYVRDRGIRTEGLSPLEALKKQLTVENGGRTLAILENATRVYKEFLSLDDIRVPHPDRLETVKPVDPQHKVGGYAVGIVMKNTRTGEYSLIDGYHRLKWLKNRKRIGGYYYVIPF